MSGAFGKVSELENGAYSGRLAGSICHGSTKAHRVRTSLASMGFDLAESTAFSNSVDDLPLLAAARVPVGVAPDRALGRIARTNGWQVLDRTRAEPSVAQSIGSAFYHSFPLPI